MTNINWDGMPELIGKQIVKIVGLKVDSNAAFIITNDGIFIFYRSQDCCGDVRIIDVELGTDNFEGAFITAAEEVNSDDEPAPLGEHSYTRIFYKIETTKGEIWMRWLGESNGYYSERVTFKKIQ